MKHCLQFHDASFTLQKQARFSSDRTIGRRKTDFDFPLLTWQCYSYALLA